MKRIDEDIVEAMNRMGYSDIAIAKKIGATNSGVARVRYRLGLKANYPNWRGENTDPKVARKNDLRSWSAYREANKDKFKAYREANKDKRKEAFYKARGWGKPIKNKEANQ